MLTRSMLGFVVLAALWSGCSATTRSAEQHRDDAQALLQARGDRIGSCYGRVVEAYPESRARVIVRFTVEPHTGKITSLAIDEGASNAPPALRECVRWALEGVALTPADARAGDVAFVWELSPKPTPKPSG